MCLSDQATAANPIIKCDGEHDVEFGVHLRCMLPPMDAPPADEWFCAACQAKSLYQVEAIVKKSTLKRLIDGHRTGPSCVHYKIRWKGAQYVGHDTWEPLENLQAPHVKALIRTFNKAERTRARPAEE